MPRWTQEQEMAIKQGGNLLVSAAAGAGKTAVMTERIARIIAEGTDVNDLLVVTFTNAAAAEMKQRIENRLLELADEEENEETKIRLNDAAADIGQANISTIHSFCGNVLRHNYHLAGIDPAFRTADEAEATLLRVEALDEVLENAYAESEKEKDSAFLKLVSVAGRDDELASLVISIYDFIIARPEPLGWLRTAVDAYHDGFDEFSKIATELLVNSGRRSIRTFYHEAEKLYRELSLGVQEGDEKYAAGLFADMNSLLALSQQQKYDSWHYALIDYKLSTLPRVKGRTAPDELKEYRDRLKKNIDKLQKNFQFPLNEEKQRLNELYPCLDALYMLVESFMSVYSEKKHESALIDFNDMEQLTLCVLQNDEIADEYRQKFRYIFIDEYQDINLVQDSIIASVSRKDNLFMVGDVKQSIYRFRQAEPENFLDKYRNYDGKIGTRIDLNANFRSMTSVLNATNKLFSLIMLGEVGEIDYSDNAAFQAGADTDSGSVEIALIDLAVENTDDDGELVEKDSDSDEDGGESASVEEYERVEAEALFAAEKIHFLMQNTMIFDKDLGKCRKPYYSDFAVLMRKTRGSALSWVNTLSSCGIPCTAELGDGYFEAIEVQVFMNLLRIIDNRRQEIPLMSIMHSPIGGFTSEELVHIKSDYAGEELLDRLIAAADAKGLYKWEKRAAKLLNKISEWYEASKLIGVEALIGRLLDETLYYEYIGILPGGAVRQANLDLLLTRAHNYEANGQRGLYGFIRLMDSIRDNVAMGAAQAVSVDAVRVMSIHKSKGLEFPIVFVAGITSGFNKRSHAEAVLLDSRLGLGLRVKNMGKEAKNPLFRRAVIVKEDEKLIAEEMRVLYVAMTRARERLYLVGADKRIKKYAMQFAKDFSEHRIMNASCYLDWLLGAYFPLGLNLDNARDGVSCPIGTDELKLKYYWAMELATNSLNKKRMKSKEYSAWTEDAKKADYTGENERLNFEYQYAEETVIPGKRSVTESVESEFDYNPAIPKFMQSGHVLTGAERGTAAHKILMSMPIELHDRNAIIKMVESLEQRGKLSHEEAGSIQIDTILRFVQSELWKRMTMADKVERELEFTLIDDVIGEQNKLEGTLIQGIIDCCFLEDGEWVIIDYKTTAFRGREAEAVAAKYKPQLDMYAKALERLTGKTAKEKWVFLLSAGEAIQL